MADRYPFGKSETGCSIKSKRPGFYLDNQSRSSGNWVRGREAGYKDRAISARWSAKSKAFSWKGDYYSLWEAENCAFEKSKISEE
jgi:hypothetical protein